MSYWSLVNSALLNAPLQDNTSGTSLTGGATLVNAANSSDISVADGPTAWLPRSLSLNGSSQSVTSHYTASGASPPLTVLVWAKVDTGELQTLTDNAVFTTPTESVSLEWGAASSSYRGAAYGKTAGGSYVPSNGPYTHPTNAWALYGWQWTGTQLWTLRETGRVGTAATFASLLADAGVLSYGRSPAGRHLKGRIAGALVIPTGAADAAQQIAAGPEPTNTTAPVASLSGGVLSCTTGVWNSYSNGTATYTYRWQSYSGSWSNISGATSATYTPSGSGTYRGVVAATNNGGNDPASDTASNEVTFTAGGPTTRFQASFQPSFAA